MPTDPLSLDFSFVTFTNIDKLHEINLVSLFDDKTERRCIEEQAALREEYHKINVTHKTYKRYFVSRTQSS